MVKRIMACLAVFLFLVSAATVAHASEVEVLMKMLLKKGMITEADYNEVMNELKGAGSIEQRVQEVEKKTSEVAQHVDKHIIHAEESKPATIGNLSIAGGITMVGQATSGNDKNTALPNGDEPDDVIDGSISADLEVSAKLGDNGEAFLGIEAGNGAGLDGEDEEIDSFWTVNADATGDASSLEVTEAWYEHAFMNEMVRFTIGKLDLSNYFDTNEVANDETAQFLSGGFVNDVTIEFPDNSAGLRVTVSPLDMLDVSIGAQSDGWDDIDEENFIIAEVDIKPAFGELQGTYRVYVWQNGAHHEDADDAANTEEDGAGWGINLDQQILDFLRVFARIGFRSDDIVEYEYDTAWSMGAAVSGSLWGREHDTVGIAYGQALLADHYKDSLDAAGTETGNEGHFETYYSLELNEHVTISPDIQVVTNAQGDDAFETVWIGGVRGQFTF
jgi:carbohydrate-selective porin OprB